MKFKRLAAFALSLAMALTLTVLPASAVTFTDMTDHWARADVESLANDGVINGYSDGTFKPQAKMTAAEALLFCARATGLDNTTKIKIAANRMNELRTTLPPDMLSWAANEMAICLETGIITTSELQALCQTGAISREISRENLAFYLVRAMQLAPLAKSLTSPTLPFSDASSISPGLTPYVYLLNMYGIVKGDDSNRFDPRGGVTRAAMASMLRRSIDFMRSQSIVVELAAYTTFEWYGGVITSATTGANGVTLLALTGLGGARTVSLPASVKVYENNMVAGASALKPGRYARINLNTSGGPETVRMGGVPTTLTGTITGLDKTTGALSFNVNGTAHSYTMDRFTQVKAGKTVGDMSILDDKAGYTAVTCQIDESGHPVTVDFTGGVRVEEGLVTSVTKIGTSAATLQVMGFNGVIQSYKIPATATISVNGTGGNLSSTYKGSYAAISLADDNSTVTDVSIDTKTTYIQGSISGSSSRSPDKITIREVGTGKSNTYEMASPVTITYNDDDISFSKVSKGWFATLMLSGDRVVMLSCYPGASTTEGVITDIAYDNADFIVTVRRVDDTEIAFTMDLYDLPDIYRNDRATTFDKLRTGDEVIVTVKLNEVDSIEATTQSANVKGTISRIIATTTGVTLDVTLTDGTTDTFTVASSVSVTQGDKNLQMSTLQPGYKVSMVVDGKDVISIAVDKSITTNNMLSGSVVYVDTTNWTILVQTSTASGTSTTVTVYATGASIMDTTGMELFLTSLKNGDMLQIYGTYVSDGFQSTVIIRT